MRSRFWLVALFLPLAEISAQGTITIRRFPSNLTDKWVVSLSLSRPFGGPSGAMKQKLLAEGWTEHYCDVWLSNCHDNPLIGAPRLSFTGTLTRRIVNRLDVAAMFSQANLGSAEGRLSGTDVKADWSTALLGTSLVVSPIKILRFGAGPMLAFLNSQTTGDTPRTVMRTGAMFEVGVRSSAVKPSFFDLSLSYRLVGKRLEGPWPGLRRGFSAPAGPSQLDANFSHFSLAFGVGWRLAS
jgi:hypothetical protein